MDDLSPSRSCELGRKEFWEEFYTTELENFGDNGDVGDVWFGKKNLERIVKWLTENNINKLSPILDVGCGNSMTLVSLAKIGFKDLTGVDYAQEAVSLSKKIADKNNVNITLESLDFLDPDFEHSSALNSKTFHVIIDKGTYDAISLYGDDPAVKRKQYIQQISRILSAEGFFLLVSCNWTKEELLLHFQGFSLHDEIVIPSIGFGGKTGQTVTALIMTKNYL